MSGEDACFPEVGGGGESMPPVIYTTGMPEPGAYEPRPTDPYSLQEAAEVIETANKQFETAVRERAEKEATQSMEVKRRAEEELDGFYDQRTDEVAKRQARCREKEEAFLRSMDDSIEGASSNPWSRVCDLVDLKGPAPISSKPARSAVGSRRSSSAKTDLEAEDVFRATEKMRSLIIQMKADAAHADGSA